MNNTAPVSFVRAAILCAGFALPSGAALAAGECGKIGSPSYQAERTVEIGGETIRSKVFVSGLTEREEFAINGRDEIRINSPSGTISYNLATKTGFAIVARKPPRPKKEDVRIKLEDQGASKILTLDLRDQNGEWKQVSKSTCRPDGAVLARIFSVPAPNSSTLVPGRMSQTITSTGPQPAALFKVPAGVKIKR